MIWITIAIVTFVVVMWIDVNSDFKRLDSGTIRHGRGLILRSVGLISTFVCLLLPLDNFKWWYILLKSLTIIVLLSSWWWEFFDGWLNLKRGKTWRYNGSDDPDDATTDNLLQKMSPFKQAVLKWGLIVASTTTFIWFFT